MQFFEVLEGRPTFTFICNSQAANTKLGFHTRVHVYLVYTSSLLVTSGFRLGIGGEHLWWLCSKGSQSALAQFFP